MDNKINLVSTNQFAKLCNVSKQTILYYDKKDLLKPKIVTEKGYRYYELSQIEVFSVIYALKSVGMTLNEIKEYFDNKDPEQFISLLNREQIEIQKKIQKLISLNRVIEKRKQTTIEALKTDDILKVTFQYQKEEYILTSDKLDNMYDLSTAKKISEFEKLVREKDRGVLSLNGIIDRSNLVENKKQYTPSYFYINLLDKCKESSIKPGGIYAIIYYKGSFDNTHISYNKLIREIDSNKYEIIGSAYEEILLDLCTQRSENEYLVKIMIPVKPIS